ncbi:membrane protein [Clostridium acetobutylicum]|nr:membrane protein [Clostridium acetobutylicum]
MNNGRMLGLFTFIIMIISIISQIIALSASQRNIYLGIRIPQEEINNTKIKAIGKRYIWSNLLLGIPIAALLSYCVYKINNGIVYLAAIILFMSISFLLYYYYNRKILKIKKEEGWLKTKKQEIVIDTSFAKRKSERMVAGSRWFLLSLIFIVICLIVNVKQYPNIPYRYATHWDINGRPNAYSLKSYMTIFSMPINQLILIAVMFFSYKITFWSKNELDGRNPKDSGERNIKFRNVWAIYAIVVNFFLQIIFLIQDFQIMHIVNTNPKFIIIAVIAMTIVVICSSLIISIKVGQGGSRLKTRGNKSEFGINMRDDDKYWRLGNLFYYNKNDPSIFVQKRFGIGWTVNVGNKFGVLFYVVIIVFVIICAAISM